MYEKRRQAAGGCLLYLYCRTDMIKELLHTDVQQLLVLFYCLDKWKYGRIGIVTFQMLYESIPVADNFSFCEGTKVIF